MAREPRGTLTWEQSQVCRCLQSRSVGSCSVRVCCVSSVHPLLFLREDPISWPRCSFSQSRSTGQVLCLHPAGGRSTACSWGLCGAGGTPDTSALCADAESITPLRVWDTQAGPAPREYPPDGVYTTMKISYKNGTLQLESLRLEIRKSREVASALEQPSGGCRLPPMEPPAPGGWSRGRADLVLELGDAAQPQRPLWAPLSLCPSCERSMLPRQRLNNL